MFANLKSLFKAPVPEPPSVIDRLTYAIGDIHGRFDLFERMLDRIGHDSEALAERPRIVLLGDYVDRGPASRQVLERIVRLRDEPWCDVEALTGNHEEAMLQFLRDPGYGVSWSEYGGSATLASYGVTAPALRTDPAAWTEACEALNAAIPEAHRDLLRQLKVTVRAGDYLFVHAGVSPNLPLAEQGPQEFLWIRGPFLEAERACDFVVVHGHTPEDTPTNQRWRIGLDSGAYATGVLTAMRLRREERTLLQVR